MERYQFTLFVAGRSSRSLQAIANLRRMGEERLRGRYELAVVDVTADPERAELARVLTTPTLVRDAPAPTRRVTGDLSDLERVLFALDLADADFGDPSSREPT
jgi:circadian clock protein KaiB